jgi:hypothetical protein
VRSKHGASSATAVITGLPAFAGNDGEEVIGLHHESRGHAIHKSFGGRKSSWPGVASLGG